MTREVVILQLRYDDTSKQEVSVQATLYSEELVSMMKKQRRRKEKRKKKRRRKEKKKKKRKKHTPELPISSQLPPCWQLVGECLSFSCATCSRSSSTPESPPLWIVKALWSCGSACARSILVQVKILP